MKNYLFVYCLLLFCFIAQSQSFILKENPKSPNTASLGTFGEIPVNFFTGKPNVSIPIHTLSSGSIKVPITLSYHPDNVKPSAQSSWVGFGWSLNTGGVITRSVQGLMDELYAEDDSNFETYASYYPFPYPWNHLMSGSERINNDPNWNGDNALLNHLRLDKYSPPNAPPMYDFQADIFSFNFLNFSGKFIYSGPIKGWEVISDQKIKIEMLEFIKHDDILPLINEYAPIYESFAVQYGMPVSRQFSKFRITTPDGTKYEFGGSNGLEFLSSYAQSKRMFSITAWHLTKITDKNNNSIEFQYKRNYPTCSLGFTSQETSHSFITNEGDLLGDTSTGGQLSSLSPFLGLNGSFQWPIYLDKISSKKKEVVFTCSPTNTLTYSMEELTIPLDRYQGNDDLFNFDLIDNDVDNIKWQKLDAITIKEKDDLGGGSRELHNFYYDTNLNRRLVLTSYENQTITHLHKKRYSFLYNDIDAYNNITCNGNFADHWGYYNGINASGGTVFDVFSLKITNPTYALKGLLNKITYPTGGSTGFKWGINNYSQVVSTSRDMLINELGIVGGARIKEITNFGEGDEVLTKKKYYYKKNFRKSVSPSTLSSSGVLNALPKYEFSFTNRPFNSGNGVASLESASFNSKINYGYNGQGAHVGYDEVVEENLDGSYTKYYYTSYGVDINGESHFDKLPTGFVGFDPTQDVYFPQSILELERGKQIGIYKYRNDDVLMEKEVLIYRNDEGRFNQYIRIIPMGFSITSITQGLIFMGAIKEYTYSYYPIQKVITSYDDNGVNPIVTTEDYKYDDNYKLLTEVSRYGSDGTQYIDASIYTTKYEYPYNSSSIYNIEMTNKHILNPIIKETKSKNGFQISLIETNYYSPHQGLEAENPKIYAPLNIQKQRTTSEPKTIEKAFKKYDIKGNLLEASLEGGINEVYIYGYNSEYIVAIITGGEGITHSAVLSVLDSSIVNNISTTASVMERELNKLREGLPNAMVSTYTYDYTYGSLLTLTDPKGKKTSYKYDDLNRLKYVLDSRGVLINKNEYKYKTE